jgi:transcriptional regulator with XRE-family HTH domain
MAVLARKRDEQRLTQREVSRRLKRAATFAHLVESGERMLSLAEFPECAVALNSNPRDLFDEIMTAVEVEEAAGRARKKK